MRPGSLSFTYTPEKRVSARPPTYEKEDSSLLQVTDESLGAKKRNMSRVSMRQSLMPYRFGS